MKAIFENSLLVRAILCLCAWYHEGAIAHFFARIREAYADSRFRRLWERFCAAPPQRNQRIIPTGGASKSRMNQMSL